MIGALSWALVACAPHDLSADTAERVDLDGDGAIAATDCDDQDSTRHPGASDSWGDSSDADCNGIDGSGTSVHAAALAEIWGAVDNIGCGQTLVAADLDGEGLANDLAIGCPVAFEASNHHAVYVLFNPTGRVIAGQGEPTISLVNRGEQLGTFLGATGLAGPGAATLIMGDGGYGDVWFVSPPFADLDVGDVPPDVNCIPEPNSGFQCAAQIGDYDTEVIPDLTGDGLEDLAVTAYGQDPPAQGLAWWAQLTPEFDPLHADGLFTHGNPGVPVGAQAAGDVNGDGSPDLIGEAIAPSDPEPMVYLYDPIPGTSPVEDLAFATLWAESELDHCCSVAGVGDLDGDGYDDVLLGAEFWGVDRQGRAYVQYGPLSGAHALAEADALFDGPEAFDQVGLASFAPGDMDGDGRAELTISAPQNGYFTQAPGHVFLFADAPRGTLTADDAALVWVGEPLDGFGQTGAATDIDGDGDTELWIAAPPATVAGLYPPWSPDLPWAGKVYLLDWE